MHGLNFRSSILRTCALLVTLLVTLLANTAPAATVVFSTDFESGLPEQFSAPMAMIEPVQGWEGLGEPGNQFSGNFLRYSSTELVDTTLMLTGLPPHDSISLGFLLAIIDSWDGGELFEVRVDDALIFSEWFDPATSNTMSYVPPEGVLLSSGTNLGFTDGTFHNRDIALDLSADPVFSEIPHSADSVTISWIVNPTAGSGAGAWQGGSDESWAIDNVTVEVHRTGVPIAETSMASVKARFVR